MDNKKAICENFAKRLNYFREASADYKKITYAEIAKAVEFGKRGGEYIGNMFSGNTTPFWDKTVLLMNFLRSRIPNFSIDSLFRDTNLPAEQIARQSQTQKEDAANAGKLNELQQLALQYLISTNEFVEFLNKLGEHTTKHYLSYNTNELSLLFDKSCQRAIRRIRLSKGNRTCGDLPFFKDNFYLDTY